MPPKDVRDLPKPWSDRVIELFPCSRRRAKTGGESLPASHEVPAMQLANIKAPSSTEIDSDPAWGQLDTVLDKLERAVEVFPPLKVALGGLRGAVRQTKISGKNLEQYRRVASELQAQITALQRYVDEAQPTWMARSIAKIAHSLEEENRFIRAQQERPEMSRIESAHRDEDQIIQSYRRVESLFRRLQTDISLSTWNSVREVHMTSLLDKLLPVPSAQYDAALSADAYRTGCTPGTRESLIKSFLEWASDHDTSKLYWMNGLPGTGKTTIAYTICSELESTKQLGACFFCSRISPDCRDVNRVFPTIAYQLAQFSNPYRNRLFEILSETPNIAQRNIAVQFENLILKPLSLVKDALPDDVVVIIDALDECSSGGEQVLSLLLKNAAQLPIKFIITSRPEPSIARQMETIRATSTHQVFHLHEIEKSFVQQDIAVYIRHALQESSISATSQDIERLAAYAGNLFIVAATSVRYILGHGSGVSAFRSRERMEATLEMVKTGAGVERQHAAIDSIYMGILEQVLEQGHLEDKEAAEVRRVLWGTLCVREPLSIETLSKILSMKSETVQDAIRQLQSVLHLSEATGMVSTFHASFPDFMYSRERAGRFYCDQAIQDQHMVRSCFNLMEKGLRFNICNLRTSYHRDEDIKDLKSQVDICIPPELFYACRYWADHLQGVPTSGDMISRLRTFLYEHLLFWIEVISLKGWVSNSVDVVQKALKWLTTNTTAGVDTDIELGNLQSAIHDAQNFVTSFSASEVSQSTPHLYLSSLPTSSKHSGLFAHHREKFHGLPGVLAGSTLESRGGTGALAVWTIGSSVISIAVSPNGTHLALSRYDGGIQIMDIRRGEIVLDLVGGHLQSGPVRSVAFSTNGSGLASGSANGTICIWDTATGSLLAGPILEHTQEVNIVVFSPNNSVLASASDDGFICLWDVRDRKLPSLRLKTDSAGGWINALAFSPDGLKFASAGEDLAIHIRSTETGTMLVAPLHGHGDGVYCVCFSLDGSRLVSASEDMTIRVWQPQDGTLLAGPFRADINIGGLEIISLSPDPRGTLLAYATRDETICVINTLTGDLVSGPFTGHTASINSVHFLPSGTRIVSGSADGTIRIWDTQYNVVEPVSTHSGHTQLIHSVAFSPDGVHVASGANDRTICIWDATSGTLVRKMSGGHANKIWAVAFSPDGKQLASCSSDRTIRIWDPHSGTLLRDPLTGHESWVHTIDFCPYGSRLVSGSEDRTIRVWDLQTDQVSNECLIGHKGDVRSAKFSPDGTRIVSGGKDCSVGLWDVQNSGLIWMKSMHTGQVNSVAFSPDGSLIVSGSIDHTILLWDVCTGTLVGEPLVGHTLPVQSLAFSPGGKTIASGSLDHTIRIWDIHTRELKQPPFESYSGVYSITFSPDGQHIVSGSKDTSIRKWDTTIANNSADDETAWVARKNGWVTDQNSRLLIWLPYDSRGRLFPDPRNILTTVAGQIIVPETPNLDGLYFGEEWHRCYRGTTS